MENLIAEIIGGFAALFRVSSLFMKHPKRIKLLVSIGNLLFLIQGIIRKSPSLIVANGACIIAFIIDIFVEKRKKNQLIKCGIVDETEGNV